MTMIMIDKAVVEQVAEWLKWFHSGNAITAPQSSRQVMESLVTALEQPQAAQPLSDDKLEQIEAAVKELTETLEDLADYAGAFSVSGVYLVEDKHARALLAQAYKLVLKYDN